MKGKRMAIFLKILETFSKIILKTILKILKTLSKIIFKHTLKICLIVILENIFNIFNI